MSHCDHFCVSRGRGLKCTAEIGLLPLSDRCAMQTSEPEESVTRLVVAPNASLSTRHALRFIFVVGAVMFGVAGWFAARGFWPVLIFAVANLVALLAAIVASLRHNAYREVLCFSGEDVRVEFGFAGRGILFTASLPRRTLRAMVEEGPYRTSPTRLLLRAGERSVEVGRCLTDSDRVSLCCRIRGLLQPDWQRPAPVVPDAFADHVWR